MYNFKEILESEIKQIKFLIDELHKQPTHNYSGTLVKKNRNGKEIYYSQNYIKSTGKKKQTPIGNRLSEEVINRKRNKYYDILTKKLNKNLIILETINEEIENYSPDQIELELPNSYKDNTLDFDSFKQWREQAKVWSETNYETNTKPMPKVANVTVTGKQVRSKGEVIIYNLLSFYNIPFRYEPKIKLKNLDGSVTYRYPDFLILLPNGSFIFWEHLGLLEEEDYSQSFLDKFKIYHYNNIIVCENLVITADRQGGSINSHAIDKIIRKMILPKVSLGA